jgi:hypothetical protein
MFEAAVCLLTVLLFGAESVRGHFKEPLKNNLCRPPTRKFEICSISFQRILIRYFFMSTSQFKIF